ncbi:Purine-cytosine permease fcy21 [Didymosphaeria variabile]|uniref:Purine-cytosine permease fcy21 n=1 Tax=Didymosphaeria variabile TaxID=1932322 RepID=A0A9W8XJR7_9PLEO|nr:Purine-cytosine permease fcy21 [Didymosphaeria variabile]KAJ4351916.1 Purine-cytosine permease fcy21 [Didymosphaeria variabile]
MSSSPIDIEKEAVRVGSAHDGAVPGETFEYGTSTYAKLQRLAGKLHVEQRGIERVPDDERDDHSLLNVGTMWLSANMVISSFAIGLLAQKLFFLGFVDAILTCLFFNMLGVISVCYFSTFGPRFGLRQMVLSRFWFGWYGVKLIAFFNVLACIGWSSVNSIVGAQLLHAVNNDVPGWAGILVIAVGTLLVTFFGYKVVHAYEFWSWIPTFIVFLIVLGEFAHSGAFVNLPMGTGTSELGNVLSFGSVVYGFATGWTSYAADYTVYQPVTQSRKKVFGAVWIGLMVPLLFTEFLGIAIMTATTINDGNNPYMEGYTASGTGGLLAAVLFPPLGGFGKFCLVVLALSIIANNCPNIYSVALTMQVLGRWTQRIPRFVWTTIATGVYIAIAIPGYSHFEEVLENFMNFIGYWLAIYEGVAFAEHLLYRRSMSAYDPSTYDQPSKLPPSIAAVFAFCCGVAGMVTGMSQVWFVGPIALHAGEVPYGGDVGFELGFAFAFVSYAIARYFERKYFGR